MRALVHSVVIGVCCLLLACGVTEGSGDAGAGGGSMGGGTGGGGSASAPAITGQPQAQTATEGDTVTFTVTATGAASWQWLRDGADVAGATTSSWTTPALSLADDGAMISVRVSNADGAVISDAVRLTVNPRPVPVLKAGGTFTSPDGRVVLLIPPDSLTADGTVVFRPADPLVLPANEALDEFAAIPSASWQLELTGTTLAAEADLGAYIVPSATRDGAVQVAERLVLVRQCKDGTIQFVYGDADYGTGIGASGDLSCPVEEATLRIELRRLAPPPPPLTSFRNGFGALGFDVLHRVVATPTGTVVWWQAGGTSRNGGSGPRWLSLLSARGTVLGTASLEERLLAYDGAGWMAIGSSACELSSCTITSRVTPIGPPAYGKHLRKRFNYPMEMGQCLFPLAVQFSSTALVTVDQSKIEWLERAGTTSVGLMPAGRIPRATVLDRNDDSVWVAFTGAYGTCVSDSCLSLEHFAPDGTRLASVGLGGPDGLRYGTGEVVRLSLAVDPTTGDAFVAAPLTERLTPSGTSKVGRIAVMRVSRMNGMLAWSTTLPDSEGVAPTSVSVSSTGLVAATTNYGPLTSGGLGVFAYQLRTDGTGVSSVTVLGAEGAPAVTADALNNGGGYLDVNDSLVQFMTNDGSAGSPPTNFGCDPATPAGTPCTDLYVTRFRFP